MSLLSILVYKLYGKRNWTDSIVAGILIWALTLFFMLVIAISGFGLLFPQLWMVGGTFLISYLVAKGKVVKKYATKNPLVTASIITVISYVIKYFILVKIGI